MSYSGLEETHETLWQPRGIDIGAVDDLTRFHDVIGMLLRPFLEFRIDRRHGSDTIGVTGRDWSNSFPQSKSHKLST